MFCQVLYLNFIIALPKGRFDFPYFTGGETEPQKDEVYS